jgi:hypothetical protein
MLRLGLLIAVLILFITPVQARSERVRGSPPQLEIALERMAADTHRNGPQFKLVLRNISRTTLNVWNWASPPGRSALAFEFVLNDGTALVRHRLPAAITLEFENSMALKPGDQYATIVSPGSEEWDGALDPSQIASIRAVYEVKSGSLARLHNVWRGRIESVGQMLATQ